MTIKQMNSTLTEWIAPSLTIIPPRSPDFNIGYGDTKMQERVSEWALDGRYALIRGAERCAHGLYRMRCPRRHCCDLEIFDHCDMWADCENHGRPFLLMHPYCNLQTIDIDAEAAIYAKAHGLTVGRYERDGWYGYGTNPVRMSPSSDYVTWPIEIEIAASLVLSPIRWPSP